MRRAGGSNPTMQQMKCNSASLCVVCTPFQWRGRFGGEHFCQMQLERGCGYKRWAGQKIGSVGACNPRSPETQRILKKEKMKTALMAGLVAGVVLGDGHGGGGGSHQSQYGGAGGGGGQTAYSSYASGAQDAFNQLGETIPGTPGEDYPILAEVRIIQLLLLTLPLLPK